MLRDPELRDACTERCETSLLECILECSNDTTCLTNCIRLETECINGEIFLIQTFFADETKCFRLSLRKQLP